MTGRKVPGPLLWLLALTICTGLRSTAFKVLGGCVHVQRASKPPSRVGRGEGSPGCLVTLPGGTWPGSRPSGCSAMPTFSWVQQCVTPHVPHATPPQARLGLVPVYVLVIRHSDHRRQVTDDGVESCRADGIPREM